MRPLIALLASTILLTGCAGPQNVSTGQPHPEVSSAPWDNARQRGVDFRAIGQEPGWYLEIMNDDQILFVYNYGANRLEFPAAAPTRSDDDRLVYQTSNGVETLTVTITPDPCTDIMSGEPFEHSVSVSLNGEDYRGCGRDL
ncbi:hypothetical protein [uncultured Marinobacter sp.]|uniref:COG3650 family protein n=1 Tax=uncultured Marinobacter sp. TaxID=187379 RepID=UPI0030D74C73